MEARGKPTAGLGGGGGGCINGWRSFHLAADSEAAGFSELRCCLELSLLWWHLPGYSLHFRAQGHATHLCLLTAPLQCGRAISPPQQKRTSETHLLLDPTDLKAAGNSLGVGLPQA